MNKILYTLLAILCIGVSACSDDDAVEVASLLCSPLLILVQRGERAL